MENKELPLTDLTDDEIDKMVKIFLEFCQLLKDAIVNIFTIIKNINDFNII